MRRSFLLWGFIALSGLVTASCTQAPQAPPTAENHDADVQAIKDNEAQWNKDVAAKDLDKWAAHYADNAVLISPGSPPANGKDAIRFELQGIVTDSNFSLQFTPSGVDVAKSGDMAYSQGSYTLTLTDPGTKKPMSDKGSYVTVYKKQADGSWKAVADIASSATPPGPPPAANKKK